MDASAGKIGRAFVASCFGKAGFSTPQVAQKVMRRRGNKRAKNKRVQSCYKCEFCGLFHLGSAIKSPQHLTPAERRSRARQQEDDAGMA